MQTHYLLFATLQLLQLSVESRNLSLKRLLVLFRANFVEMRTKAELSLQLIDFVLALLLDPTNLLALTLSVDFIKISKHIVNQGKRELVSMLLTELVSKIVSSVWNPVIICSFSKITFFSIKSILTSYIVAKRRL